MRYETVRTVFLIISLAIATPWALIISIVFISWIADTICKVALGIKARFDKYFNKSKTKSKMKKFKVAIPKNQAMKFAEYAFSKEIRIMMTITNEGGFFGLEEPKIECFCFSTDAVAEEIAASEWKQFIVN